MKRSLLMLTGCAALLFTACSGRDDGNGQPDGNGDGSTQPTQPTTLTVSGKVLGEDGKPVANATVLVLGKTSVTTDAAGVFSVSEVKAPYDIVAVNGTRQSAIVYKGVTRKDPTLSIPDPDESPASTPALSGTITGKITGAQTPSSTVSSPEVKFVTTSSTNSFSSFDTDTSSFSAEVKWSAGTSLSGMLVAFQGEQDPDTFTVTRFTGFGRRDKVTLGSGATLANQDITLGAVTNSTLSGSMSVPEGLVPFVTGIGMRFSPEMSVDVQGELGGPKDFKYAVPVVPQTTFDLSVIAISADFKGLSFGSKRGLAAGTTVNVELKALPTPQQPADKATGVARSTEFSWSGTAQGSVNTVVFAKKIEKQGEPMLAAETPFSIAVVTNDSRTSIPDLSALGMALPANTDFTWSVGYYAPLTSVDSVLVSSDGRGLPTGVNEVYAASSAPREFKTAATP